jgi:hypothetical protein
MNTQIGGSGLGVRSNIILTDTTGCGCFYWQLKVHGLKPTDSLKTALRNGWAQCTGSGSVSFAAPDTLSGYKWQYELPFDSLNSFTPPFPIKTTSIITYNGSPLKPMQYSRSGPVIILGVNTRKYDYITIIQ